MLTLQVFIFKLFKLSKKFLEIFFNLRNFFARVI